MHACCYSIQLKQLIYLFPRNIDMMSNHRLNEDILRHIFSFVSPSHRERLSIVFPAWQRELYEPIPLLILVDQRNPDGRLKNLCFFQFGMQGNHSCHSLR